MPRFKAFVRSLLNDSRKLLLVGGSILVVVAIALIIGITAIILNVSNSNKPKPPVLSDKDITVISSFIKFSDEQVVDYKYQSVIFDFEADINTKDYKYNETANGISLYNDAFTKQGAIVVTELRSSDSLEKIDKNFTSTHNYLKNFALLKSEDALIDGSPAKIEHFSYQNYSGAAVSAISAFSIHDKYVYEFQYIDSETTTLKGDELNLVLNNFKFIDGTKINAKATYDSSLWGYTFDYDVKYWILNKSDYTTTLTQREPTDFKNIVTVNFYSQEVLRSELKDNESTFLKTKADARVEEIKARTAQGIQFVSLTDEDLVGRKVKVIEYKDVDATSTQLYKEYLILHFNTLTTITVQYADSADPALQKVKEALDSLKIAEPTKGVVKGLNNTIESDEKAAILTKPAVAQIFFQRCGSLKVPTISVLPLTSGKNYNLCAAATGSGFFINADGYVATNGHVVSLSKADFQANAYNVQLLIDLFKDLYLPKLIENDPVKYSNLSDSQIFTLIKTQSSILYGLADATKQLLTASYNQIQFTDSIYVQKGTGTFELGDITTNLGNPQAHLKATLVDIDFDEAALTTEKEKASDVAILKVDPADYPTLTLGDNQYTIEGSQILAVGFPAAANTLSFINKKLETQETFTKGLVSRIIATTGDRKLLQIDASINHGNSGGPLINVQDAKVLGLVTYGADAGASDFNFARDVADLKKLMDKNGITNKIGQTQQDIDTGVDFFFDGKYSKAVEALQAAKTSYPDIEGVDKIIGLANDKISQGLDYKEPVKNDDLASYFNNMQPTEKILFAVVTGLICIVFVMAFGILMIFAKLRKRKTPAYQPVMQQPQYVQNSMPVGGNTPGFPTV